jgi:hypothetical protein
MLPFPSWASPYPFIFKFYKSSFLVVHFDSIKIRVNARDELVKLISQFADDCANSYNKITENYNQLDKIIHSLEV